MTEPGMQPPLDTPEKLLDSNFLISMVDYDGAPNVAFGSTTNALYQQMWTEKVFTKDSTTEIYKRVSSEGSEVFVDFRIALEASAQSTLTDALGRPMMYLANYDMFRFSYAWAVEPCAMYMEMLNSGILEARSTGHVDFYRRQSLFYKKNLVNAAK